MSRRSALSLLVQTACIWEATARKPGNVHRYADFPGTTYLDFLLSAAAIAEVLGQAPAQPVGRTILQAVTATREMVGQNTNLGIILLLAPLAAVPEDRPLRAGVANVLERLTVEDARDVYQAIRLAHPGGLGDAAEQDVRDEPTVTLRQAMELAADRDRVARQYATGFADVFDFGLPAFQVGLQRYGGVEAALIHSQLGWLAKFSDSLVARKLGPEAANEVRRRAAEVLRLGGLATAEGRTAGVALDRFLRSDGNRLNPGTTADLITACLFVALRENIVQPSAPFVWNTPGWLSS